MKLSRIYLIAILLVNLGGCDFLKYDETTNYNEQDVFTEFERTKDFLTNIYAKLPHGFNSIGGAMRASGADDAEEVYALEPVQQYNDGSWSAINTLDNKWGQMFDGIRAANKFLEKTEGQNFEDLQYNYDHEDIMEQYQYYRPQARFLRAFFYFELLKRYGQTPIITEVLTVEEANQVQSSSFDEVANFIVSELNAIIPELPVDYQSISGSETGRATRGAAMALKARTLLYAASPLHNESNDQQAWIDAAEASKAIIDSVYYSLDNNYGDVVNNRGSNELIFERRLPDSNFFERSNFPVGFEGAEPGTAPTQNLVDSYEMQSTGLAIDETGSGYDPSNPYEGRDPRLSQTVIYNNSDWKGRSVELWNGGIDAPPEERASNTGYYLKKYVVEDVRLAPPSNDTEAPHTWVFFRYGEVLLNYAEAMNEVYGPDNPGGMGMTARQAVNQVRGRANMPDFPAGMPQSDFREKLRNERRVELAFEDHRFWDIRRWEIGPSTTDIYGMEITQNSDSSFNYNKEQIEDRVWNDRMYLYPIPQSEIFKNDNLQQNPGW